MQPSPAAHQPSNHAALCFQVIIFSASNATGKVTAQSNTPPPKEKLAMKARR